MHAVFQVAYPVYNSLSINPHFISRCTHHMAPPPRITRPFRYTLPLLQLLAYLNSYTFLIFQLYDQHTTQNLFYILPIAVIHFLGLRCLYYGSTVHTAPRAKQEQQGSQPCRKCGHLIYIRDHHCVYLGQCVGKHNYKDFFSYVFFSYLTSATDMVAVYGMYARGQLQLELFKNFYTNTFIVRFAVFSLAATFFIFFTANLLSYQLYMILNGLTSKEHSQMCGSLKYTLRTFLKACISSQQRTAMKQAFVDRWRFLVGGWWEFLYSEH